ncbi:restriction endonuclease subunit S [Natroniella acetigena]|uniref:restriction endonuclease subunit S n=1 Tax=Natroniella acetigena TaxID=52004 RepID=UPI00200A0515|nr:restriction endonuclease subunit S [Natroniella acetigena]MCK8827823.1 restriction endonuclease subunit S [Natroniella acetigena]
MPVKIVGYSILEGDWTPSRYLFIPDEPDYPTKLLKEVADINEKSRLLDLDDYEDDSEIQLVEARSVDKKTGKIIDPRIVKVGELPKRARLLAFEGDILIPLLQTNKFMPALVKEESMLVSDYFAVVVPQTDHYYLFWALSREYVVQQIKAKSRGSVITRLRISELEEVKIPWLSKEERNEKANLVKKQFNKLTRKEMAILFKERIDNQFNDLFGVEKNRLTGRLVSKVDYKDFTNKKNWSLKPFLMREVEDLVTDSEKLKIYKLEEIVDSIDGGINPYRKKSGEKEVVKLVKANNLDNLLINEPFDEEELEVNNDLELKAGDILMRRKGNVGPAAVVTEKEEGLSFHDHLVRLKVDTKVIDPNYLAIYLNSNLGQYLLATYINSTTMKYITLSNLKKVKVIVPEMEVQKDIVDKVTRII